MPSGPTPNEQAQIKDGEFRCQSYGVTKKNEDHEKSGKYMVEIHRRNSFNLLHGAIPSKEVGAVEYLIFYSFPQLFSTSCDDQTPRQCIDLLAFQLRNVHCSPVGQVAYLCNANHSLAIRCINSGVGTHLHETISDLHTCNCQRGEYIQIKLQYSCCCGTNDSYYCLALRTKPNRH